MQGMSPDEIAARASKGGLNNTVKGCLHMQDGVPLREARGRVQGMAPDELAARATAKNGLRLTAKHIQSAAGNEGMSSKQARSLVVQMAPAAQTLAGSAENGLRSTAKNIQSATGNEAVETGAIIGGCK